jgi:hypothetical protein
MRVHSNAQAPGGGAAPTPSACLDSGAANAVDCGALPPPDPTCAAPSITPLARCTAYRAYFAPKVAAAAVSCVASLSSKQVCDAAQVDGCAQAALSRACPDPTIGQLCGVAATACKSSASDCAAMLSGLNDQGKQQVAQCVAMGCSAGLYACIQGLAAASAKQ